MIIAQAASINGILCPDQIRQTLTAGLEKRFTHQKVLVLIPDHTRSLPLPFLFRKLAALLHDTTQLDFMVALGTHPRLGAGQLRKLVGISAEEKDGRFRHIRFLNHRWDLPDTFPVTLVALVVIEHELSGLFIGDYLEAWRAAADLSSQRHIVWVEKPFPRAVVNLTTQIPPEICASLGLGYRNPAEIDPVAWQGREDDGILYVPRAGEMLYRVRA